MTELSHRAQPKWMFVDIVTPTTISQIRACHPPDKNRIFFSKPANSHCINRGQKLGRISNELFQELIKGCFRKVLC